MTEKKLGIVVCDWCKGKKTLDIEYADGSKESNPCPHCNGSGQVDLDAKVAVEKQLRGFVDNIMNMFGISDEE